MAKVSAKGIRIVKNYEGLRLRAYVDPVGVWTIGYGHTGTDVYPGQVITEAQAEAMLRSDLRRFELGVQNVVARAATQGQFDAMVSLAYNIGLGAFAASTLLKRFNAGDFEGAAHEFASWIFAPPPVILPGLVRRRVTEAVRFTQNS